VETAPELTLDELGNPFEVSKYLLADELQTYWTNCLLEDAGGRGNPQTIELLKRLMAERKLNQQLTAEAVK
jgi:hypothetical protein